jgi:hypothetical protein
MGRHSKVKAITRNYTRSEAMGNREKGTPAASTGCGGAFLWTFFSFMYFLTTADVLPLGKWEYVWRFFAGPINFLFS